MEIFSLLIWNKLNYLFPELDSLEFYFFFDLCHVVGDLVIIRSREHLGPL